MPRTDTFHRSLWSAITPAATPLPAAQGSGRADVAIVGGGLLGLAVALSLAEAGSSVMLLESHEIGYGASGRNTGFVVPALKGSIGPDDAARLVGAEKAERLLRLVGGAGTTVFELIRRLGIACAAEQTGCLQPGLDGAAVTQIERQVRSSAALGIELKALDAAQTFARTGIPGYRGSMLLPSGGQLNPLAYVRGLAAAAVAAGARICLGQVTRLERHGTAWRLGTSSGDTITADTVVLATNALIGRLSPPVARSLLPVQAYQVATQPLDRDVRDRILVGRQPAADLRHHPFALRWSPDHRLVTGGGGIQHAGDAVSRMGRFFLRRLNALVPGLPVLHAAYAWSGMIAGTGDFLPRFWELGRGLYAPIGCNGRGIALSTALGAEIGAYLLHRQEALLAVPVTSPTPWRLHGLMRFAPSLWLAQARLRDWRNDALR